MEAEGSVLCRTPGALLPSRGTKGNACLISYKHNKYAKPQIEKFLIISQKLGEYLEICEGKSVLRDWKNPTT